ncbi:hypothetical protein [Chondrinema litorale]|uniref:hypothetical protein n=1 Tax=Chondrinema litorale TaxID=2994555 RepID=UPI002543302E|nr:hypothetical protein [Chondrinema litorale]UZR98270.1 hypothetical protein OQ292_31035 [Chondrinema litorale]
MLKRAIYISAISSVAFFTSCHVENTKKAEVPDVEVDVDEGELPKYNVEWADVDVKTRTKTIEVPKVVVVMEEKEVEIPYVDFDMPNSKEKEEKVVDVEIEVTGESQEVNIEEVYLADNNLVVVSKLEDTGKKLGDQKMRVSDRIIINLPEDKDVRVKHYVIGNRPAGSYNNRYSFISSKSEIPEDISHAKQII